jgi:beta-fructofuranosidase
VSRQVLASDPHRPTYHFLAPSNWLNDPNGLIQWRGQYHLFYQHNPFAPVWGSIHWGHAVSDDLVHWRDLPIALAPTPGGEDEFGVFSGCAVDDDGVPTLVYTGVRLAPDGTRIELPCLATSTDDLLTWHKHPANPVIAAPPPDLDVLGFRDHSVWKEDGLWYQAIGSGIRGVGGTVLLYRSPDLVHWDYVGPLCTGDSASTGDMWECPDLFALGDGHVLMVSPIPMRKTLYFSGTYAEQRFVPSYQGVVDDGGYFYAPQSFTDQQGRRIMFGWLWEGRDESAQRAAGWAGVMSLPRVLLPRAEGRLGVEPAPELQALRGSHERLEHVSLAAPRRLTSHGAAREIAALIEPGPAAEVGLRVRCSPDGTEATTIVFDTASRQLTIDRQRSSLDPTVHREVHAAPVPMDDANTLRLHVFVDHSIVEVFANGETCLSTRIYPSRPDSLGVEVFATGPGAELTELDAWQMDSIWSTRP